MDYVVTREVASVVACVSKVLCKEDAVGTDSPGAENGEARIVMAKEVRVCSTEMSNICN
jgi:hypothetical protein